MRDFLSIDQTINGSLLEVLSSDVIWYDSFMQVTILPLRWILPIANMWRYIFLQIKKRVFFFHFSPFSGSRCEKWVSAGRRVTLCLRPHGPIWIDSSPVTFFLTFRDSVSYGDLSYPGFVATYLILLCNGIAVQLTTPCYMHTYIHSYTYMTLFCLEFTE